MPRLRTVTPPLVDERSREAEQAARKRGAKRMAGSQAEDPTVAMFVCREHGSYDRLANVGEVRRLYLRWGALSIFFDLAV